MELLTREDVRRMSDNGTRGPVVVNKGQTLTPGARDWLAAHKVQAVYPQGREEGNLPSPAVYRTPSGATLTEKPEHMTHLKGNILVPKDHPRIAFRGMIDALEAETLLTQRAAADYPKLVAELEEVLSFVRNFIRCDVLDEPLQEVRLCGPDKHLGQPHFLPSHTDSPALLAVNRLRTLVRQTELSAYAAFKDADGAVTRGDIILGLNRLSSLMWIMMCKLKGGQYERH